MRFPPAPGNRKPQCFKLPSAEPGDFVHVHLSPCVPISTTHCVIVKEISRSCWCSKVVTRPILIAFTLGKKKNKKQKPHKCLATPSNVAAALNASTCWVWFGDSSSLRKGGDKTFNGYDSEASRHIHFVLHQKLQFHLLSCVPWFILPSCLEVQFSNIFCHSETKCSELNLVVKNLA